MRKFQIVVDSASDMLPNHFNNKDILLNIVPLTIHVGEKEFVDNESLDIPNMLKEMYDYPMKSTSSCPPVGKFEEMFLQAENTICITISGSISGTYNSACLAAEMAREKGCNVHVVDSKQTSGAMMLIAEKCYELMQENKTFEEIVSETEKYRDKKTLLFVLDKFDNLIKNGRMSKMSGVIAGFLKIKPIATTVEGEIKLIEKKRTTTMAIKRLMEIITEKLKSDDKADIVISHCFAEDVAAQIETEIKEKCKFKSLRVIAMRGLCSFYSLEQAVMICM